MRDPRYDILFEPVKIGPVTAKNRFYQVPHCNGGGYRDPSAVADMRRVKAEGGWAVRLHRAGGDPSHLRDHALSSNCALWDDADMPVLARMAEAIHEHGALAGIELVHAGINGPNLYSREVPLGPTPCRSSPSPTIRCRRAPWTRRTSRNLRRWHRAAFRRAKRAGYRSGLCLCRAWLRHRPAFPVAAAPTSAATNMAARSKTARACMREIIEDTKDAVGDTLRRAGADGDRRDAGPTGLHQCRSARCHRACMPSCPTSGTWRMAPGRTAPAPRASRRKAARKTLSPASRS